MDVNLRETIKRYDIIGKDETGLIPEGAGFAEVYYDPANDKPYRIKFEEREEVDPSKTVSENTRNFDEINERINSKILSQEEKEKIANLLEEKAKNFDQS